MRVAWGVLLLSSWAWSATWAPPQLHPRRFAACLRKEIPTANLTAAQKLGEYYHFGKLDLYLLHLSVYPGVQMPGIASFVQNKARRTWSDNWDANEKFLARRLATYPAAGHTLVPQRLFAEALASCGPQDFFCAAALAHNVLRTLGRHPQGIYTSRWTGRRYDYNPAWFQNDRAKWLVVIPEVQKALVPLRSDGLGDRWGEWYHVFGILAYGIHEAALGKSPSSIEFIVRMNELLNPWLAGGPEEPEKARMDRDSIEVAQWFLTDTKTPPSSVDCNDPATYVAGEWEEDPEPFPVH